MNQKMKSICEIAALIVIMSMTGVAGAFAGTKSVTVTNNTTYTMTEFYASASTAADWSTTNLFAGQTLAPGQQTTIPISDGIRHCKYDLMAVLYGADQYAYTYSVNACGGNGSWTIQ